MEKKALNMAVHIKSSPTDRVLVGFAYGVVGLCVLMVLYPLIYVISCSVSDPVAVGAGRVVFFPQDITLIGYRRVFQDKSILTGYGNTLFYAVVGTLINLIVTVPCGFSLAKNGLPGKKLFLFIFMFTMYFGGGMVPQFLLIRDLNLYNTRWVLLILGAFNCYNCIICRTFFAAIPQELGEAAAIDGCGTLQYFIQIVLPISQALLGVMVLYFAVGHWNSYFNALMYTSSQELKPLQLVLRGILVESQTSAAMMADSAGAEEYVALQALIAQQVKYAVIVVSSLPMLVLYPFLQKYFVKGVLIGSVKG